MDDGHWTQAADVSATGSTGQPPAGNLEPPISAHEWRMIERPLTGRRSICCKCGVPWRADLAEGACPILSSDSE